VLVLVLAERGDQRLVEERQVHVGEID